MGCVATLFPHSQYKTIKLALPQSQGNTLAEEAILEDNQKGYDVILVERQEGLQCKECDLVLRDAVQTCEGIRMCRPCYDNIAR